MLAIERAQELRRYFAEVGDRLRESLRNCHAVSDADDSVTSEEIARRVEHSGPNALEKQTREDIRRTQAAWLSVHGVQRDETPARLTLLKCVFGHSKPFRAVPASDAAGRRSVAKVAAEYFETEYPKYAARLGVADRVRAIGAAAPGRGRPRKGEAAKWAVLLDFVRKAGFSYTGSSAALGKDWRNWSANWGS